MPQQIREEERIVVFRSTRTGRIVGFGKSGMPAMMPGLEAIELFYAHEMDSWSEKFRKQEAEDRDMENAVLSEREAPARKALKGALLARRAAVDPISQRYIDANLAIMEQRHQRMLKKRKTGIIEGHLLHEEGDNDKHLKERLTLASPHLRPAPEKVDA